MRKYLISFMKWLLAVVLVAVPFIAGIGCNAWRSPWLLLCSR